MPVREKADGAPSSDYKPVRGTHLTGLRAEYRELAWWTLQRAESIKAAGRTDGRGDFCDDQGWTYTEWLLDAHYFMFVGIGISIIIAESMAAGREVRAGWYREQATEPWKLEPTAPLLPDEGTYLGLDYAVRMWEERDFLKQWTLEEFQVLYLDIVQQMRHGEIANELKLKPKRVEYLLAKARGKFGEVSLDEWQKLA